MFTVFVVALTNRVGLDSCVPSGKPAVPPHRGAQQSRPFAFLGRPVAPWQSSHALESERRKQDRPCEDPAGEPPGIEDARPDKRMKTVTRHAATGAPLWNLGPFLAEVQKGWSRGDSYHPLQNLWRTHERVATNRDSTQGRQNHARGSRIQRQKRLHWWSRIHL